MELFENNLPESIDSVSVGENQTQSDSAVGGQEVAGAVCDFCTETTEGTGVSSAKEEKDTDAACQDTDAEEKTVDDYALYRQLIQSDRFKSFYAQDIQRLLSRRFREKRAERAQAEATRATLEQLAQCLGAGDAETLSARLQNDALKSDEITAVYPDAGAEAEMVLKQANLLGCSPLALYRALHMDRVEREITDRVQKQIAKQMADHVRSGQMRAAENGTLQSRGVAVGIGRGLTREDRAKIAARAAKGEHITL